MKDPNGKIIHTKSYKFALDVIQAYKLLTKERREFVMSNQLLRSGTSIGANVKEAIRGQSKADFIAKLNISLKEASESEYWIELLAASEYLTQAESLKLLSDCKELIKILTSIINTSRKSLTNS